MMFRTVIASLVLSFSCALLATPASIDRIVAIVNDDVVTQTELGYRTRVIKEQMSANKAQLPPDDILEQQVLNRLIEQKLVLQMGTRYGITIDDQALDQALYSVAKNNKTTVSGLRTMLEKDGINYQQFLSDLRTQLATQRIEQRLVGDTIHLSQEEVENVFKRSQLSSNQNKRYRLGHILIPMPKEPTSEEIKEAEARAQEAIAHLNKGQDFTQVALTYSGSKDVLKSTDLGLRRQDELPTLFSDVAPTLTLNQVQGPIRNSSGLHIIKLLELEDNGSQPVQMVKETHVRHILISPNQVRDDEKAKAIADEVYAKIKSGEDFAALAKVYSEDPGSKQNGGDLEWVQTTMLVPEFAKAMEHLGNNELSAPVHTQYGWHVIQVLDRRERDISTNAFKSQIQQKLYERKLSEALQNWYIQLRDQAMVQTKL